MSNNVFIIPLLLFLLMFTQAGCPQRSSNSIYDSPDPTEEILSNPDNAQYFKAIWQEKGKELITKSWYEQVLATGQYLRPETTPYEKGSELEKQYLEVHRYAWNRVFSSAPLIKHEGYGFQYQEMAWQEEFYTQAQYSGFSDGKSYVVEFLRWFEVKINIDPNLVNNYERLCEHAKRFMPNDKGN